MKTHSPSFVQTLQHGMVLVFIFSFFLSLFSLLIGSVSLEQVQGVIIVFPFIFSISGLFDLVFWITLLLCSTLFFFWLGRKKFPKTAAPLIPISHQCPTCATFLPVNAEFCFICGQEFKPVLSTGKKVKRPR